MTTVKLHYSEDLVRKAVKAFWWRSTGWSYFAAFLFVLAFFCHSLWNGDGSWKAGLYGTVLGLGLLVAVMLYMVHYRGTLARFRRMQTPEGILALNDEKFHITTDAGSMEMPWSSITEIWRFPDFWLLFFSRAQFITLPTVDMGSEAQGFVLAKAKACGAKVV